MPSARFSALDRSSALERAPRENFDLLVVGGGIVGAAVAWDAALRGLNVALLDKGDFASGASSKSSKLLHGGLRYLEMGHIGLVYESLAQRNRLFQDAPHVATRLDFLLPIFRKGPDRAWLMRAGLTLYDVLSHLSFPAGPWHKKLGPADVALKEPAVRQQDLVTAFVYADGLTEDARLVIETLKSAVSAGASAFNYVEVTGFLKDQAGQVVGVEARDVLPGGHSAIPLRAAQVLLATGPWLDALLQVDDATAVPRLRPTKGVHLLVPARLTESAVLMRSTDPSEKKKRLLFAIPWQGRTLLGTTDTDPQAGSEDYLDTDCEASPAEGDYILAAANQTFGVQLTAGDVISSFAGWRPLIAPANAGLTASAVSREHEIFETKSGLLAIAGGKLTSYRTMARQVVDRVCQKFSRAGKGPFPRSVIERQSLSGSQLNGRRLDAWIATTLGEPPPGLDMEAAQALARRYGTNWSSLKALLLENPDLARPLTGIRAPQRHWRVEVAYAVRHEGAVTPEDFLMRRTRLYLLDENQGLGLVTDVATLMADLFAEHHAWSTEDRDRWLQQMVERYRLQVFRARGVRGGPL